MTNGNIASMTSDLTVSAQPVLLSEDALDQVSAGDLFGVMHHTIGTVLGGILSVTGDVKNGTRLLTHQPKLLVKNVKELFS